MNKTLYFILIITLFFQCKKAELPTTRNNIISKEIKKQESDNCIEAIKEIVHSSNLNLALYKNNYSVDIESINSDTINIHVYTENNLSDNPKNKELVESTIAWLVFLPNNQQLLNITANPDSPVNVEFDKKILKTHDIFKLCQILKVTDNVIMNDEVEKNCKKISGDMMSGEECLLKDSNISDVYKDIILKKMVDDSNFLIKELPTSNQVINVNNDNGLISINYIINQNNVKIEMLYEGGITEIILIKKDLNILRKIIYNAD